MLASPAPGSCVPPGKRLTAALRGAGTEKPLCLCFVGKFCCSFQSPTLSFKVGKGGGHMFYWQWETLNKPLWGGGGQKGAQRVLSFQGIDHPRAGVQWMGKDTPPPPEGSGGDGGGESPAVGGGYSLAHAF